MATNEERREARTAALREKLDRAAVRKSAREAALREREATAQAREIARRMKRTPADGLASWKRPVCGEPPAETIRCSVCLQMFRNRACWEAHRVHVGATIERCALGYELGAAQWERSVAGVWTLGAQAMRSDAAHLARHARLALERLATARQERERFDFGIQPQFHFPAKPAQQIPAVAKPATITELPESAAPCTPDARSAEAHETLSENSAITEVFETIAAA